MLVCPVVLLIGVDRSAIVVIMPVPATCQAVDPLLFLRTVTDLDGNPIDVSVQQDAQGFLLDLFDKMEVSERLVQVMHIPAVLPLFHVD